MLSIVFLGLSLAAVVAAHGGGHSDQVPIQGPHAGLWYNKLPGDGGTQVGRQKTELKRYDGQLTLSKADSVFSGITTFARLEYFPCLASDEVKYDIAFIGMISVTRDSSRIEI
jgi:agmatinase